MSGARTFRVVSSIVVSLVVLAGPARADEPASAAALFARGREALERNDPAAACRDFAASVRLDPATGTLLGLARCEEAEGKIASSLGHLREGIDRLPGDDPGRLEALANAVRLERRVPRLRIRSVPTQGVRVFRDGIEVDENALATELLVDPGHHEVLVVAPERGTMSYAIELREGELRVLDARPGPTFRAEADARRLRLLGYGAGAAGGVLVTAGVVTGVVASTWAHVVHDHCDASHVCDARGSDALDHAHGFGSASTVTWIAGGVVATAGVVLVLLGRRALTVTPSTTASVSGFRF